jgi:hypothetical protein
VSDDPIRQGRDPAWRRAWEERLSSDERKAVEAHLARRISLDEPLLSIAIGLAHRRLRQMRIQFLAVALHLPVSIFWVGTACSDGSAALCIFWVALAASFAVLLPVVLLRRRARLLEATDP